jgi:hypothetical protein
MELAKTGSLLTQILADSTQILADSSRIVADLTWIAALITSDRILPSDYLLQRSTKQ